MLPAKCEVGQWMTTHAPAAVPQFAKDIAWKAQDALHEIYSSGILPCSKNWDTRWSDPNVVRWP